LNVLQQAVYLTSQFKVTDRSPTSRPQRSHLA